MKYKNKILNIIEYFLIIILVIILKIRFEIPFMDIGYISVGDSITFILSLYISPILSFFICGISSFFSNYYFNFGVLAILSFFIKGLQGYFISSNFKKNTNHPIGIFTESCCIVAILFFISVFILENNVVAGLISVGIIGVQSVICVLLSTMIYELIIKCIERGRNK